MKPFYLTVALLTCAAMIVLGIGFAAASTGISMTCEAMYSYSMDNPSYRSPHMCNLFMMMRQEAVASTIQGCWLMAITGALLLIATVLWTNTKDSPID